VEDPPSKAHNGEERRRNIRREEEAPKKGLVKLYFPVAHTRGGPPAAKESRGWRGVGGEGRDPVGEGAGRERVRSEGSERSLKDVQMCEV